MKNKTKISYKGIPAKERARVKTLFDGLLPECKTRQEIWTHLQNSWALQRADEEAKKAKTAEDSAASIRADAIEDLNTALGKLTAARDLADWIAKGNSPYFDPDTWAMFTRMAITEAGKEIEWTLFKLGLVEEASTGYFVDGPLKREGVKKEAKAVAHEG